MFEKTFYSSLLKISDVPESYLLSQSRKPLDSELSQIFSSHDLVEPSYWFARSSHM